MEFRYQSEGASKSSSKANSANQMNNFDAPPNGLEAESPDQVTTGLATVANIELLKRCNKYLTKVIFSWMR